MTQENQDTIKDRMIAAMLTLAAERDWRFVAFDDIAEQAGVPLRDAYEYFDDRSDILAAYGRRLDRAMIEQCQFEADSTLSCREKIFDLVMERFDIVNRNRAAILSILQGFRGEPKDALMSLPHLGKSMSRILDGAGMDTGGIKGAVQIAGMTGLYLYTLKTWMEDESADLAKTMATLDQALDKAEALWNCRSLK